MLVKRWLMNVKGNLADFTQKHTKEKLKIVLRNSVDIDKLKWTRKTKEGAHSLHFNDTSSKIHIELIATSDSSNVEVNVKRALKKNGRVQCCCSKHGNSRKYRVNFSY